MAGYAVEIALKLRICRTLRWAGYPSTRAEFNSYQSFRTHDLDVLLTLSGVEQKVKSRFLAEWSVVAQWDPEVRYKPIGTATRADAAQLIRAAGVLLGAL